MANPTIVFITGASRGIGHQLVRSYLSRPNYTVIGSVRNTSSPGVAGLKVAPKAEGSVLFVVKIDSTSTTDAAAAVEELEQAGIDHVDVVVACAAHNPPWVPVDVADPGDLSTSLQANVIGPMVLFQALRSRLERSPGAPKWMSVSSVVGSVGLAAGGGGVHNMGTYGISKAALNWFTAAVHGGNKWLVAFAVHPGYCLESGAKYRCSQVQTEPGNMAARMMGQAKAPETTELAAERIMTTLDNASREETSGRFLNLSKGTEVGWTSGSCVDPLSSNL